MNEALISQINKSEFEIKHKRDGDWFCPIINNTCKKFRCYSYIETKLYLQIQKTESRLYDNMQSFNISYGELSTLVYDLENLKDEYKIKYQNIIPAACTYLDYYAEMPSLLSQME